MKFLFSFVFFLFFCNNLLAQKVFVEARDERNELLTNVSADLFSLPDTIRIDSKLLAKGIFFTLPTSGLYFLKLSSAGKQHASLVFSAGFTDTIIKLTLFNKSADLTAVTVVSKKPLIKQEDDKTIVDAAALTISSTNAYEVLEKTPGAVVDQDGNVYLNSTTPATIFINGKEMKLSSADLASLLKSLPANSVSKIEILSNPSAKYDAASSGGILNIVLKKGVKIGTNGSANLAYFQGVYSTKTAGVNLNRSIGKLTSYISYQFTQRKNFEELMSDRFVNKDSIVLRQNAFTTYPSVTHYGSIGLDYSLNEKWTIGYDLRTTVTNNSSNAYNDIDIRHTYSGNLIGENASSIQNDNRSLFTGNSMYTKYKMDTLGSEWTNNFELTLYDYKNNQLYSNFLFQPAGPTILGDGTNRNKKTIFSWQSDLAWKLPSKYSIEAGVKINTSNSKNSAVYFIDTGNNVRLPDLFQTNTFRYKETIGAAYIQVSKTFWGFTVKPGVRFEYTDIRGRQLIPGDTVFSIKRSDVFPYVFLRHKLFKIFGYTLVGNAIYRRSIRRPYYESLNPYAKYIDQYLYEAGNPALKPQFTTNYEVNVTFNDIPVFAFGVNQTKDIFSNVTYQDDDTKIALRTFDNLGKNKEYYFKIIGGIPPGGKYFFYMGAQYNYNQYRGFYQGQPLNYNRGSYTFFMYQEYKFSTKFTMNMQGFMRTRGLQNFYELNNFGGLFVSFNRSIMKRKANLILSVNDLLQTNRVSFRISQADVNASGRRINDTRRLGLTFRYNFGIKPREEKKGGFDVPSEVKEN